MAGDAADFPPYQTIYDTMAGWQASRATEAMHGELREQCRIAAGRKPQPTAAVIDSQSVKAAEEVTRASRGYDAGKKINRKRHIAVDTIGLLLTVLITAASVQDRDAAKPLPWNMKKAIPAIRLAWADGIYGTVEGVQVRSISRRSLAGVSSSRRERLITRASGTARNSGAVQASTCPTTCSDAEQ